MRAVQAGAVKMPPDELAKLIGELTRQLEGMLRDEARHAKPEPEKP